MEKLSQAQIKILKGKAQLLNPVLWVGKQGMTDAFITSLDQALSLHPLVKIKFNSFKEQKDELAPLMAEKTSSHLIGRVGNTAVFLGRRHPRLGYYGSEKALLLNQSLSDVNNDERNGCATNVRDKIRHRFLNILLDASVPIKFERKLHKNPEDTYRRGWVKPRDLIFQWLVR